jgi:hypothetical protein
MSLASAAGSSCSSSGKQFEFEEATVDVIHQGFKNGRLTSTALVQFYLDQISRLNPLLHAVIEVNPDALAQAARADAERSASGGRCDWYSKSDTAMRETTESICSVGGPVRIERWAWCCGGSQHGSGDTWIRDGRLHPLPIVAQLCGWDQTNCWVD